MTSRSLFRAKSKDFATRNKNASKRKHRPKLLRIQCLDSTKKLNLLKVETKEVTSLTRSIITTESLKLKIEINWPKKLASSAASVTRSELRWLSLEEVLLNSKRMAAVSATEIYLARPKACSTHEEVSLQKEPTSNQLCPTRTESIKANVKNLTRDAVKEEGHEEAPEAAHAVEEVTRGEEEVDLEATHVVEGADLEVTHVAVEEAQEVDLEAAEADHLVEALVEVNDEELL